MDRAGSTRVALVGESMARRLWPGGDPLGHCLLIGDSKECTEVVGVVADVKRNEVTEEAASQYYVPMGQWPDANAVTALYVRTAVTPDQLAAAVRREMQAAAPGLPYADVRSFEDVIAPQLRPWRVGATMFSLFGALALTLAAVGLYGVLAYTVSQRTHEVGVRIALGAEGADILRLVIGQGLKVVALGVAIGTAGALAAGRLIRSLLYGVSPGDPFVLVAVTGVLLAVAAFASYWPARQATKVDPMVALRYE